MKCSRLAVKRVFERAVACVLVVLLGFMAFGPVAFADDRRDGGDLTAGIMASTAAAVPNRGDLAQGTYCFQSSLRSMYLLEAANDAVRVKTASGLGAQQWAVSVGVDGYSKLKNVGTGKVLTVSGGATAGASVRLAAEKSPADPNASGADQALENLDQKWVVVKSGEKYLFVSALNANYVLNIAGDGDAVGYSAELQARSGNARQTFSAMSTSAVTRTIASRSDLAAGTYYIQAACLATHVLDSKGNNVRLGVTSGDKAQRWKLVIGRDGFAKLKNVKSGKVLALAGGTTAKTARGANVRQSTERASVDANAAGSVQALENLDQKWIVKKSGKRYFLLSALNQNCAVRIAGKKTSYNAALGKRSAGDECELFTFVPKSPTPAKKGRKTVKNGVYMLATTSKAGNVASIAGSSRKSGANAQIEPFAASQAQTFQVVYDKRGFYTVTNTRSGKKLAPVASCSVPGINVGQYQLGDSRDRAKWRIDRYKGGYRLVNKATGLALQMADSSAGGNVCASTKAKTRTQRFSLVRPCDKRPASSTVKGTFFISMNTSKRSVVGIRDDSRREGASVSIRDRWNTNLQRFEIKSAGKGAYYLENVGTHRVVSLARESSGSVNVVMRDNRRTPYQKWNIVYNDDFSFAFESVYSGKRLHVVGGNAAGNTKIKVSKARNQPAQQFRLRSTSPIRETVAINVPCYLQNPQLPTGCESVALTNAIRYWGYKLGKTTIADHWMPYGNDGVWNFIGNPRDSSGWIICAPGIAKTANRYLSSHGSSVRARVVKGHSLSSLRESLDKGFPVVVWTTIGMGSPGAVQWWNSGYPLRSNNHAVVLSGYNPKTGAYRVSDSLAGVVWRSGGRFEWLYNQMGQQAVVLER